jgi:hypothetical protein
VTACQHWLTRQHAQNWLLFFDNADDVHLNLATFFPDCRFGNILITTRNPQLRIHADEGAYAKVADMNPEDAKCLLMRMSHAKKSDENEKLAALIVQVIFKLLFLFDNYYQANSRYRISTILHLPSPKLVLTFFGAPHSRSMWGFIKSIVTNFWRPRKFRARINMDWLFMQPGN